MGMGWLGALRGTSSVMSTFAPMTLAGLVATEVLGLFGLDVSADPLVNVFRAAGLLLAAWLGWLLLCNSRRIGTELALGLTLLLAVVLGPVMWPWYLPPAIVVLVAAGAERFRPALIVVCVSVSIAVLPTSAQPDVGLEEYHAVFRMGLAVVVVAAAMVAQWVAGEPVLPDPLLQRWNRWRALRAERPGRDARKSVSAPAPAGDAG
jgi:hypothetical protein